MSSVGAALRAAAERIGGDAARAEAELLLAAAIARPRAWLYAHGDDALEPTARDAFLALVARRCAGEPVAHLLGRREFWSLSLEVSVDTLIPRPETELLVEQALARMPPDAVVRVLDLGTGSGAIALAIAHERPQAAVTAVDASAGALAVAQRNGARLGLAQVHFLRSDWFSALGGERFGLIVANPPYIADDDPHLRAGDLRFEPHGALASGRDGLDDIRRIVAAAPAHLLASGWLLLEHGFDQGESVRALLRAAGFESVSSVRDWEQRERVSLGQLPG